MRDYVQDMASGRVLRGYVSAMPLKPHLPDLIDDIEYPEYREIGSTSSPRIWLGTRVIGPLHYDPSRNLHGIVYGGKRFTLFHPSQLPAALSMLDVLRHPASEPGLAEQPRLRAFPETAESQAGHRRPRARRSALPPRGLVAQVTTPTPTISIDSRGRRRRGLDAHFCAFGPATSSANFAGVSATN